MAEFMKKAKTHAGMQGKNGRNAGKVWIKFAAAFTGACFLFSGTALAQDIGWVKQEEGWYYYFQDGIMAKGWVQVNGLWYYLTDSGLCLLDGMTPDGYYVNGDGAWYRRTSEILGVKFTAPERFLPADSGWTQKEELANLQYVIQEAFGSSRRLRVTDTSIEYVEAGSAQSGTAGSGTSGETVLAGLYREPEQGRYRLDLRMTFDRESTSEIRAATYDYGVFRAMLYQVSSSPEVLEEAVYSAWQGENLWKIGRTGQVPAGDSRIGYTAGNGYGRFFITAGSAE